MALSFPAAHADGIERDPRLKDFRNFLFIAWRALGLPPPTEIQYDVAHFLQHGPDRLVVQGFRGMGKSWITAAFVVWALYWNPAVNVLIVSASKSFADDISTFILQIIRIVPNMGFLDCIGRERHSKIAFDVGPAPASKQPSVKSVGITGQMTGSRADIVLSDDVESLNNSLTQRGREQVAEFIKEYDAIVKPQGRVLILGTPQTEQSMYNLLPARGYTIRVWPVEYPNEALAAVQADRLAPMLLDRLKSGTAKPGDPTDPARFGPMEIEVRRASYGRSGFALQFQLDTSLSDADRYPLKLRDLIVMPCDPVVAPAQVLWSNMPSQRLDHLDAVGFNNDRYYAPIVPKDVAYDPYKGTVMAVDPAGVGGDETAYAVVRHLHGRLFVPECTGLQGGYADTVLVALAEAAKRHGVNKIIVEANFGDGMFSKLLTPHLQRIYPCSIEEVKHSTQKERRILDVLEPVVQQHRLIVAPEVIERDGHRAGTLSIEQSARYMLFYQFSHITRDRGSLAHDDRVDVLSIAVAYWTGAMARDSDRSAANERRAAFDRELREFFKNTYQPGRAIEREPTWVSSNAGTRR